MTKARPASAPAHTPSNPLRTIELAVTCLIAAAALVWLLLLTRNAGPLWRDELCSLNLAQLPSFADLWSNLHQDSCPLLWPLLLRIWSHLGLGFDAGARLLGLLIGTGLFASIVLTTRWLGTRLPLLSLALLGFCPVVLYAATATRPYGIGILCMTLALGLIWRTVESPSTARLIAAFIASLLCVQSLYINCVLLFAFLLAGIIVRLRRRDRRTALILLAIGVASAASMLPYLPVIHSAAGGLRIVQMDVGLDWLLPQIALAAGNLLHVLAFVLLAILATALGLLSQSRNFWPDASDTQRDRSLFCTLSLLLGSVLYIAFYYRLQILTQAWYFAGLFVLLAILFEALVTAQLPQPHHTLLRLVVSMALAGAAFDSVWTETHTRRTNVDLIAVALTQHAAPDDLILVHPFYCGTTFERHYTGKAPWLTIPAARTHLGGGFDDVAEKMTHPHDAIADIRVHINRTLAAHHRVFLLADLRLKDPLQPPTPPSPNDPLKGYFLPYSFYWFQQVSFELASRTDQVQSFPIDAGSQVNPLESLLVTVHGR